MSLRLLIVDDSKMYRQAIKSIVADIPGVHCIGEACDGKVAMEKIIAEKPDVVTLDMEMPVMSGMDVIKAVTAKKLNTKLIVVSACSQSGAEVAITALKLGAYDFITKPVRLGGGGAKEVISQQLKEKLKSLNCGFRPPIAVSGAEPGRAVGKTYPEGSFHRVNQLTTPVKQSALSGSKAITPGTICKRSLPPKAIAIGCSTGGPKALLKIFSSLQGQLDVPAFIVQHMPPVFTQTLAQCIDEVSPVSVKEAEDGEIPLANHAYIAPGGRQMKLIQEDSAIKIRITDDETSNYCKPSVDYFFSSVAEIYGQRALGVILSGMGNDGREGLRKMKHQGVTVLGQDKDSCVVYGMPRAAQEEGLLDQQVDIGQMALAIERVLKPARVLIKPLEAVKK